MSFNPEHCPPDLVLNQPEPPSVPSVEPTIAELREWSAKWLRYDFIRTMNAWFTPDCDYIPKHKWRPDQRIDQAWLLVEKLSADDNIDIDLRWIAKAWTCDVWRGAEYPGDTNCWQCSATETTAPLAILKAAYRAAQGKETP